MLIWIKIMKTFHFYWLFQMIKQWLHFQWVNLQLDVIFREYCTVVVIHTFRSWIKYCIYSLPFEQTITFSIWRKVPHSSYCWHISKLLSMLKTKTNLPSFMLLYARVDQKEFIPALILKKMLLTACYNWLEWMDGTSECAPKFNHMIFIISQIVSTAIFPPLD